LATRSTWDVQLVGSWQLRHRGKPVKVTLRQQRLVAVLALKGPQPRSFFSGLLWPDSTEKQAAGSLRESIWMITHQLPGLLVNTGPSLALAPEVGIDVDRIRTLVAHFEEFDDPDLRGRTLSALLDADLLPGWYDDWVTAEQDRWTQMRLTALERLAEQCLEAGETDRAREAASCAASIDPLRESAQRLLLEAHVADGNYVQTLQTYRAFTSRLRQEYGVEPSERIHRLVAPLIRNGGSLGIKRTG
jgi:DNA-binding SARP family transcriptional activator